MAIQGRERGGGVAVEAVDGVKTLLARRKGWQAVGGGMRWEEK